MNSGMPMPEAPWGPLLALYIVILGLASGVTLAGFALLPSDPLRAHRMEQRATVLALALLAFASVLLVVDLGRPLRFLSMLTRFSNLGSPIALAAKLIALKMALLGVYLYLLERRRPALLAGDLELAPGPTRGLFTTVRIALAALSVALAVYPALLLSRTWLAPLALAPGSAVLFLTTALLMGAAWAQWLAHRDPEGPVEWRERIAQTLVGLVGSQILLFVVTGLAITGSTGGAAQEALHELVAGRGSIAFWSLVVVVGLAGPLLAERFRQNALGIARLGAVAVLFGASATRWLLFGLR